MTRLEVKNILNRLFTILESHKGDSAAWIASLINLYEEDEAAFYSKLNSQRMWGGAGSIANEALADNPGMDEWEWQMQIKEFRELMVELAVHLKSRGNEYPDVSTWMMAFSHWNQSEV